MSEPELPDVDRREQPFPLSAPENVIIAINRLLLLRLIFLGINELHYCH
jgi:hypothetical protein